jgi:hypothetical protein
LDSRIQAKIDGLADTIAPHLSFLGPIVNYFDSGASSLKGDYIWGADGASFVVKDPTRGGSVTISATATDQEMKRRIGILMGNQEGSDDAIAKLIADLKAQKEQAEERKDK